MNKVVTTCPHCKRANTIEKMFTGMQDIRCSHCSKSWEEDLSESNRFVKTAHPGGELPDLAVLRVQVRAQMDELVKRINGLLESRAAVANRPAKFNTSGVEKSDVAGQELQKALANGKPLTFRTLSSVRPGGAGASSGRFNPEGVEKSDVAGQELAKALANGKRI